MGNADSFETGNLYLIIAKSMTMLGDYSEAEKQYAKADSIFMNTVGIANVYSLVNRYHTANNLFRSGCWRRQKGCRRNNRRAAPIAD
jgi:hypothetical protein